MNITKSILTQAYTLFQRDYKLEDIATILNCDMFHLNIALRQYFYNVGKRV